MLVLSSTRELVVVDKPGGILVHSSAWAGPPERTLVDLVREVCGPGWHPLHRLDRQTSGVVAFAREGRVAAWQDALAAADKRYWALVRGHVRGVLDVDHPLRDDGDGRGRDVDEHAEPRAARSVVTPLALSDVERCSLVEVRLFTGRRHQARRHLKHVSHPVIGDATHGKGPLNRDYRARFGVERMALHARSLALDAPATDEAAPGAGRVFVVAPLPAELRAPLARLFTAAVIDGLERSSGEPAEVGPRLPR